ncbi:hypothetical protein NQ315_005142 [Exocentrus adspersus]|uniref:Reverse transcriptase zinc-binding domain-containing protein n=1 Tax=Exocentrus adspersus TaxID=1586481 RepID=A0AAV8VU76_9CUCU|nr:hypothetical protein NQ315_005142 [Exocentrus adspersus]
MYMFGLGDKQSILFVKLKIPIKHVAVVDDLWEDLGKQFKQYLKSKGIALSYQRKLPRVEHKTRDIEKNVVLNQYIQHPVSFKGEFIQPKAFGNNNPYFIYSYTVNLADVKTYISVESIRDMDHANLGLHRFWSLDGLVESGELFETLSFLLLAKRSRSRGGCFLGRLQGGKKRVQEGVKTQQKVCPLCPECGEGEDTPIHLLGHCIAFGRLRHKVFGTGELQGEEMSSSLPWTKILTFIRASGRLEEGNRRNVDRCRSAKIEKFMDLCPSKNLSLLASMMRFLTSTDNKKREVCNAHKQTGLIYFAIYYIKSLLSVVDKRDR